MLNPYETPNTHDVVSEETIEREVKRYGGIGRLSFLLSLLLFFIAQYVLWAFSPYYVFDVSLILPFSFILIGLLCVATAYRLKNIGMTTWLAPMIIIPLINFFIVFRCLAFQEGYQETKKLDLAGKIVTGIILASLATSLASMAALWFLR